MTFVIVCYSYMYEHPPSNLSKLAGNAYFLGSTFLQHCFEGFGNSEKYFLGLWIKAKSAHLCLKICCQLCPLPHLARDFVPEVWKTFFDHFISSKLHTSFQQKIQAWTQKLPDMLPLSPWTRQCMRQFFCQKTEVLAATSNLHVEQNSVHLGRFLYLAQKWFEWP